MTMGISHILLPSKFEVFFSGDVKLSCHIRITGWTRNGERPKRPKSADEIFIGRIAINLILTSHPAHKRAKKGDSIGQ